MDYSNIPFQNIEKICKRTEFVDGIYCGKCILKRYRSPQVKISKEIEKFIYPYQVMLIETQDKMQIEGKKISSFRIIFTISGCGKLVYEGREYLIPKGCGCYINCKIPYKLSSVSNNWNYTILDFIGKIAEDIYNARFIGNNQFSYMQFPDFEERQYLVIQHFQNEEDLFNYDLSCHAYLLLTKLLHAVKIKDEKSSTIIMQIISYMQKHFAQSIKIEEIAMKYHFSPSHFRRIFYNYMQISPQEYLMQLRINYAKGLLKNENKNINDVAQECGFHTTSYFIKTFKRRVGMTPLRYRQEQKST